MHEACYTYHRIHVAVSDVNCVKIKINILTPNGAFVYFW